MSHRPPGTLQVLRLLAFHSILRMLRAAHVTRQKRQAQQKTVPSIGTTTNRQATPKKAGSGLMWLMALMVLVAFAISRWSRAP